MPNSLNNEVETIDSIADIPIPGGGDAENLSGDQLAAQLWHTEQLTFDTLELPDVRRERHAILNQFAEHAFSQQEKNVWDFAARRAIVALAAHGFLQLESPETGSPVRVIVFDTERMRTEGVNWLSIKEDVGEIVGKKWNYADKAGGLARISEGIGPVFSQADFDTYKQQVNDGVAEEDRVKPRDLFYVAGKAPLTVAGINTVDCYLGLWDARWTLSYNNEYPSNKGAHESVPNVAVAAVLFHKNWGAGYRDEYGNLQVKYPDGVYRVVSNEFFRAWSFTGRFGGTGKVISSSPKTYLPEHCQKLLKLGLVKEADFKGHSGVGGTYEYNRLVGRGLRKRGAVMVDGVEYYLGNKYFNTGYTVSKLSPDFAVVVNANNKVERIFKLVDSEEKALLKERSFPYTNLTEVTKRGFYSVEEFTQSFPDVTEALNSFTEFLEFSKRMEALGIQVVSFSAREQSALWEILKGGRGRFELEKFVGNDQISPSQKIDRIKTLLVVAENINNIEVIGQIADERNTDFLFENMAAISDIVGSFEQKAYEAEDADEVTHDRIRQIGGMIQRHASKIFLAAHDVIKGDNTAVNLQDASTLLFRYRKCVESWYFEHFLKGKEDSKYMQLLNAFDTAEEGSNMQTLLLGLIEEFWNEDVLKEAMGRQSTTSALARIKAFYEGNEELFATASETTGDTVKELTELNKFFAGFDKIEGLVVDLACGDGKRITEKMADMLNGKAKVIGLDIWPVHQSKHENLDILQGAIDSIPLPDDSVAIATLNWSPPNDWVRRKEQLLNFAEIGRVLKPNGTLRLDIAHLEGGDGSWLPTVESQYVEGDAQKFGDMKVMFPGGREGEFHIYPFAELRALLQDAGFSNIKPQVWITRSGKPRITIQCQYTGKENPLA